MSPRDADSENGTASDADTDADGTLPSTPPGPDSSSRTILELESGCTRCPALADARECISWGNGPEDASVVVVGEAPGYGTPDADRWKGGNWTGMAYTSRHSGRRVRRLLERVGVGDDAYYTNAVKCFPADPDDPTTNREPTTEERANCRSHLLTELEHIDPVVVLATGKHATKTVLAAERERRDENDDQPRLEGFVDSVLEPVRCDELGVRLVPVFHPSYQDVWIGRQGYEPGEYRDAIREVLEEAMRAA